MSVCGEIFLAGYSTALDCVEQSGHDGLHRSFAGSEWGDA